MRGDERRHGKTDAPTGLASDAKLGETRSGRSWGDGHSPGEEPERRSKIHDTPAETRGIRTPDGRTLPKPH